MSMPHTGFKLALVATLMLAASAHAHQVWLEPDAQGAKLYFGEFGENLRETSPGRLDKFVLPTAYKPTAKGGEALKVAKSANGFTLQARLGKGESLVAVESAYPIIERKEGEKTVRSLYVPAARLVSDFSQQAPRLTLDLVPTGEHGKDGVQVQALYKGQPLPKAKIAIVTASGWAQEQHADVQGKLTVKMPWKGHYVLEVKQVEGPGERGEDKYDKASYVTSLTLTQTRGLPALPAAPPATPSPEN